MSILLSAELRQCLEGRLACAVELAQLGGQLTMKYFQSQSMGVERKGDDSPVTIADKEAEQLIRNQLSQRFPEDAILGEEFGSQAGTTDFQWIVDPIDGTKSFISGVPIYSTLIGIVRDKECLAGVIYIPALDEIVFAARGEGAWYSKNGSEPTRCRVSSRRLAEGLFVTTQLDSFSKRGASEAYRLLEQASYISRTWGDGYGYLLVATGRAEVMVDPIANPWDLAAVQTVVEEAGGRFTSWNGERTVFGGDGIGSNAITHDEVLRMLNTDPSPTIAK